MGVEHVQALIVLAGFVAVAIAAGAVWWIEEREVARDEADRVRRIFG